MSRVEEAYQEWADAQQYHSRDEQIAFEAGWAARDAEIARLQAERGQLKADHDRYQIDLARLQAERDQLRAVLEGYEQWETDLVMTDSAWDVPSGAHVSQDLFDRLVELQGQRNTALGRDEPLAKAHHILRALEGNT